MEVVTGQGSGVETEGDHESNDSNVSNASANSASAANSNSNSNGDGNNTFQIPQPSASRSTPEPRGWPEPAGVMEDGYLGDCSSDGGNEMNFPMPAHLVKRHNVMNGNDGGVEPPAGLAFQNVASTSGLGYQVLPQQQQQGYDASGCSRPYTRKMRSSIRSRLVDQSNYWNQMRSSVGERRLRTAASVNNADKVAKILASGGVEVNAADELKRSALHFAASKGYAEVVETLLQHGADPNAKDVLGNTALHLAACTNHIQVVTLLLRAGTDVTTLDNNGRTPMQLAQSKLNLLQKKSSPASEVSKVKTEVAQVVDMMREYLSKTMDDSSSYSDLLNSFSQRLTFHNNQDDIHTDLQKLLDSLGDLHLTKS